MVEGAYTQLKGMAGSSRRESSRLSRANNTSAMAGNPLSPPTSHSPPARAAKPKPTQDNLDFLNKPAGPGSEPINPDALPLALKEFEEAGRQRERTPGASPSRKRQRVYADRFIPNRDGQDLQAGFSLLHEDGCPSTPSKSRRRPANGEIHSQKSKYSKFFDPHTQSLTVKKK